MEKIKKDTTIKKKKRKYTEKYFPTINDFIKYYYYDGKRGPITNRHYKDK